MTQISESRATLRLFGDDLVPDDVTKSLGCQPTTAQYKGQEIVIPKSGRTRLATTGMWRLDAPKRRPEDLEGQVSELFDQLTDDRGVWDDLAGRFDVDLFVGLFLQEANEGCDLSPGTLQRLGERGIELKLDIYYSGDD